MKIFVKLFIFLYLTFISLFLGLMVRWGGFIPLGNSCTLPNIETFYSPHKTAHATMKTSLCGLLQNQYITLKIIDPQNSLTMVDINENRLSSMDINQVDINWSGHPWTTRSNPVPKIIWKDDYNIDIYVKTKVRFGTEKREHYVYDIDPKTHATLSKPFTILVHYQRED